MSEVKENVRNEFGKKSHVLRKKIDGHDDEEV